MLTFVCTPTSLSSTVLLLPHTISRFSRFKASVSSSSSRERAYRKIRFWKKDGRKKVMLTGANHKRMLSTYHRHDLSIVDTDSQLVKDNREEDRPKYFRGEGLIPQLMLGKTPIFVKHCLLPQERGNFKRLGLLTHDFLLILNVTIPHIISWWGLNTLKFYYRTNHL